MEKKHGWVMPVVITAVIAVLLTSGITYLLMRPAQKNRETTTLTGQSVTEVRQLLGEPPMLIRSIAVNPQFSREIWVFMPFEQDPTGLYLFFKGGQLVSSRKDEFNGLFRSGLLDSEDFWQN